MRDAESDEAGEGGGGTCTQSPQNVSWIHAAVKILREVGVAYAWWTPRPWSPNDPCQEVDVGVTEVKSWVASMVAL